MAEPPPRSPRVREVGWGRIQLEGGLRFKDAKVFPGGAREWDWRETGTRHEPGIQPADVAELVERGARVVVLSRGMAGRLAVAPETLSWLEARGVRAHVLDTPAAVERYNELRREEAVGALFHTAC